MFFFKKRKLNKKDQEEQLEIKTEEDELRFLNEEIKRTPPGMKQNEYLKRRNEILMGKIPIDEFEQQHNIVEKMNEENETLEVFSSENIKGVEKDGITRLFNRPEKTIDNNFWKTYLDLDEDEKKSEFSQSKKNKKDFWKSQSFQSNKSDNVEKANSFEKSQNSSDPFFASLNSKINNQQQEKIKPYDFDEDLINKTVDSSNVENQTNINFEKINQIKNHFEPKQENNNKDNINNDCNDEFDNAAQDRMWQILKNQSLEKTLEAMEKNEKIFDSGYDLCEDELIKELTNFDDPLDD